MNARVATAGWLGNDAGLRLLLAAALALAGLGAFILYETVVLGWPVAREQPALFDAYHLLRSIFAAAAAALLVTAVVRARATGCALDETSLDKGAAWLAVLAMAGALGAAGLLAASPAAFHAGAREDSLLEWVSALLLLIASGIFAMRAAADFRRGAVAPAILGALLSAAMFMMGMEEISWLQRVIGFGTPEPLAEVNWQGEFNLHNIQTDLSELLYYAGAALFLTLFPLVRETAPRALLRHPLARFAPGRDIAVVSAPMATLTYGHWNLLPVQLAGFLSLFALLAFARAARLRGARREGVLFLALALALAIGQALVLAYGATMIDLPDATEYKELFIALGFAWYAIGVRRAPA